MKKEVRKSLTSKVLIKKLNAPFFNKLNNLEFYLERNFNSIYIVFIKLKLFNKNLKCYIFQDFS